MTDAGVAPASFGEIVGQNEALRTLQGALRSERPSHAYLLYGPVGVGKTSAAMLFARALNCDEGGIEPCGACLACRRILHGTFRDLEVIGPGDGAAGTIEIERVRDLISRASMRPAEGRRRIFLLPRADRLSPPSMHTLLKTLEEPADDVTLILETRDLALLLPTLVSRCQTVRFHPVKDDIVEGLLRDRGVRSDRARSAAAFARGSVSTAVVWSTDDSAWKRRGALIEIASNAAHASRAQALALAEALQRIVAARGRGGSAEPGGEDDPGEPPSARTSRLASIEAVQVLSAWVEDLLAVRLAGERARLRNLDHAAAVHTAAPAYSDEELLNVADSILVAEQYLLRNANPRMLFERLALRLIPSPWPVKNRQ